MNESKFLSKKIKNNNNERKKAIIFVNKIFLSILLVLVTLIVIKANPSLKDKIKEKVFNSNFSFATLNKWYKEKFGDIIPTYDIVTGDEVEVFDEKLNYESESLYKDGVKLNVSSNYLVPVIQSGIVIFIGEKENYGQTVIVQQVDGIDVWYGNIDVQDIKLYDYVEKGKLLGETKDEILYLVFQKEGEYLNYKEYI